MEKADKLEKYALVRLPHATWQEDGEELVLDGALLHALTRCGEYRLVYKRPSYGLVLLYGGPGTGKSVAARYAADGLVRRFCGRGNALVVNVAGLLREELGRSQQIVSELFADIGLSAGKVATFVIWDDAESVFVSRRQVSDSREPSDLLKVTTALNRGIDDLKRVSNVLQLATCNLTDIIDEAIKSRMRVRLHFPLPSSSQRREIIRRQVHGCAGERVLEELVAATDGWSGRDLAGLAELAFIYGTGSPEELSAADFLWAVGVTAGSGALVPNGNGNGHGAQPPTDDTAAVITAEMVEEAAMVAATVTNGKEDERCQNGQKKSSRNGYQQAPSPRPSRSDAPLSWFERLQRCPTWPPLPPV